MIHTCGSNRRGGGRKLEGRGGLSKQKKAVFFIFSLPFFCYPTHSLSRREKPSSVCDLCQPVTTIVVHEGTHAADEWEGRRIVMVPLFLCFFLKQRQQSSSLSLSRSIPLVLLRHASALITPILSFPDTRYPLTLIFSLPLQRERERERERERARERERGRGGGGEAPCESVRSQLTTLFWEKR